MSPALTVMALIICAPAAVWACARIAARRRWPAQEAEAEEFVDRLRESEPPQLLTPTVEELATAFDLTDLLAGPVAAFGERPTPLEAEAIAFDFAAQTRIRRRAS